MTKMSDADRRIVTGVDEPPSGPINTCKHPQKQPTFDAEAAKDLDPYVVRERWPRGSGMCPDCGARVICYASYEHYLSGDW